VDSWWIPGGIDTCSKNIETPKITQEFLAFLEDSWWIPGGIDTCSKNIEKPKITQEFLAFLEDSWRN